MRHGGPPLPPLERHDDKAHIVTDDAAVTRCDALAEVQHPQAQCAVSADTAHTALMGPTAHQPNKMTPGLVPPPPLDMIVVFKLPPSRFAQAVNSGQSLQPDDSSLIIPHHPSSCCLHTLPRGLHIESDYPLMEAQGNLSFPVHGSSP
jgi:hypothetical protein